MGVNGGGAAPRPDIAATAYRHESPEQSLGAALEALLGRHSVGPRRLHEPAPTEEELWLAAFAALRAPDHQKLSPFAFVVLRREDRPKLARLFEDFARAAGGTDEDIERERERAHHAPLLVAFVARIAECEKVPAHEQWLAAGGALANFMTALHAMGYACKMLSGRKVNDPAISRAFCAPGERLVGWIAVGTPSEVPGPRRNESPEQVLRTWTPPPEAFDGATSRNPCQGDGT